MPVFQVVFRRSEKTLRVEGDCVDATTSDAHQTTVIRIRKGRQDVAVFPLWAVMGVVSEDSVVPEGESEDVDVDS